jgi:hypothetical protein
VTLNNLNIEGRKVCKEMLVLECWVDVDAVQQHRVAGAGWASRGVQVDTPLPLLPPLLVHFLLDRSLAPARSLARSLASCFGFSAPDMPEDATSGGHGWCTVRGGQAISARMMER